MKVKLLWMGVDLFFILSGFLITGVLLNARQQRLQTYIGQFYARRVRRILVPYFITLVLVSLIFGIAWMRHWYLYVFLTNLLLPLHIPHPVAFDPLWSLAVEEQFYFVWPFAVYFLDERHLKWLAIFLIALTPCLRFAFHFHQHWPIYTLLPFRMDLLAVGGLLCLTYRNARQSLERWALPVAAISCFLGLCGLLGLSRFGITTYGNTRTGNALIYECSLLMCMGLMLWALSGKGVGVLCLRPLTYVGKISYSMYLVHMGVLILLAGHFSAPVTALVGLTITITYASISWYLVEKPLLDHSKKSKVLHTA
jgi:peptidoglycan/LPS O-acetylase OafA/YrhL